MKKLIFFLCVIFLVFGITGVAGAAPNMLPTWYDADKTGIDDSLLCWAASASNTLAYTGWTGTNDGIDSISTADDIFAYFNSYWPDGAGNAYYGHEWWFTGSESAPLTSPTGGGGFYNDQWVAPWPTNAYFETWMDSDIGIDAMVEINTFISENRGITIDIDAGMGHALTVWGIDMDPIVQELYVTDSDDGGLEALKTFEYYLGDDGYYYMADYINGTWQTEATNTRITGLTGLINNVGGILPYYDDGPGVEPVPEPATLFLVGSGLMGLFGLGRKKFFRR